MLFCVGCWCSARPNALKSRSAPARGLASLGGVLKSHKNRSCGTFAPVPALEWGRCPQTPAPSRGERLFSDTSLDTQDECSQYIYPFSFSDLPRYKSAPLRIGGYYSPLEKGLPVLAYSIVAGFFDTVKTFLKIFFAVSFLGHQFKT